MGYMLFMMESIIKLVNTKFAQKSLWGAHPVGSRTPKRRKQMGRPINKRFFGTSTDQGDIRVRFKASGTEYDGYIVKQKGSKKFVVTDGTVTATCTLTNKNDLALSDNEMTIKATLDSGLLGFVTKLEGRSCVLSFASNNTTITSGPWGFASSTSDGYIQFEEAGGMAVDAIRGNATVVSGNVDITGNVA
jgi:hypothetical protein